MNAAVHSLECDGQSTYKMQDQATVPDIYLIGHSHGLSVLDGITDWREKISADAQLDPRYSDSFQA